MKRVFILVLLSCLSLNICYSQSKITVSECLNIKNTEDSLWITRYENEILKLEQQDKSVQDFTCDALFLGSSSFRMWSTMKEDMTPLHVVNRGYGGASIRDLLHNYKRIISKYQPKSIVFYTENDMIGYKTDISISETFDLHRIFFQMLHRDFPGINLYILSVKPSYSRKALLPKHQILNNLYQEYADRTAYTTYLDVATPLLNKKGKIRPELYRKDKLHLNADGYRIWTRIIKPHLIANQSMELSHNYIYKDTVVKGGDNHNLITRIYLPEGKGPWPVVITRTPYAYSKTKGDNLTLGQEYVKRGMGFIQQYCRGKGGSEGTYEPNIYEREDGLALINWVAGQPWCRSIGLFGTSYTALTCWIVADSLPDKVKGIYLHHYGIDRHLSAYKDGLFRHDILTGWAIDNAGELKTKPTRHPESPYYEAYLFRPHKQMDTKMLGVELPWYRDWIGHPDYNDSYWENGVWGQLKNIPAKIKVPMTIVAGLFDHHLEGTLKGYELLPPETKKNSRLILGAWNHYFQITPAVPNTRHAKDIHIAADQFDWLYKVVAQGTVPEGNAQTYFIKADQWITSPTWPLPVKEEATYYLTKQKSEANLNAYRLADDKPEQSSDVSPLLSFCYDPQHPVMSVGGETLFCSSNRSGSLPQPKIGYRDDILFFISTPLTAPLTIAGPIKAVIYASSDCDDTCITYKISEINAEGIAYNIRSGTTTMGYRNNRFASRQPYTPHEVVALNIETLPVTWQIKPGNRLRIDITSSNFPEYSIHSNYAGIWSEQSETRKANQVIYTGGKHTSHFSIPTIDLNQ